MLSIISKHFCFCELESDEVITLKNDFGVPQDGFDDCFDEIEKLISFKFCVTSLQDVFDLCQWIILMSISNKAFDYTMCRTINGNE